MNTTLPDPNHYERGYDTKRRFASYWHQIDEIRACKPGSVLEIGIGNGFLSQYLKQHGVSVQTLDIDPRLKPDAVGSATAIPFPDNSFDVVAAFEILEHLPYKDALVALREMHRASRHFVIFSVPDDARTILIDLKLPYIKRIKKLWRIALWPRAKSSTRDHQWEIGLSGYPLPQIQRDIKDCGFSIKKTYRVFENHHHRFFVLEKRRGS